MKFLFTNEAPLIKYGLAQGFIQAGHAVHIMMGEQDRLWGIPPEEQAVRLNRAIQEFKPDFVFTDGYPGCSPEVVGSIVQRHRIPHVYWAIEDPTSPWVAEQYVPFSDVIFTTTIEFVPKYRAMGKKSDLLLFGCNPEFHRRVEPRAEYQYDIVLVGSNYSNRYNKAKWFVMPLVERGYNIKIWGPWWDDPEREVNLLQHMHVYGGLLPYEELPAVYSSAKIILGMNCDDTSQTQTSMRPYEALACGGGVFLAHYTKAQHNIFGDLIYQTKNTEETIDLVNAILSMSEQERRAIAKRAQDYVYAHHTYKLRAEHIVDVLNG